MHKSAMLRMQWFVDNYIPTDSHVRVLDVGSYDVNGCYRTLFQGMDVDYVGLDMTYGKNVNYVPQDPYRWNELGDASFDFVISGNAFEHIEYPWLTIREIYRVLKTGGLTCILAPNSSYEHRYPVDCYRYFSDGFRALARWGGFEVVDVTVSGIPVEDSAANEYIAIHNDVMMILAKGIEAEKLVSFPRLKYEKRYRHACEWEWRYNFMFRWCNEKNRKDVLQSYLERECIKKLYIYGYKGIGKIVYEEIKGIREIEIYLVDQQAEKIFEAKVIKAGVQIDEGQDSFMLCAVLDMGMLEKLNQLYPHIRKKYIDDVFKTPECPIDTAEFGTNNES